jgi:hypothetical protein
VKICVFDLVAGVCMVLFVLKGLHRLVVVLTLPGVLANRCVCVLVHGQGFQHTELIPAAA